MSDPITPAIRDGIRAGLATAEHHVGGISEEQGERLPVFSGLLRLASIVLLHADDVLATEVSDGPSAARAEAEQLLEGALESMADWVGHTTDALPVERAGETLDALAAATAKAAPGLGLALPTSGWDEHVPAGIERLDLVSAGRLVRGLELSGRLTGATAEDLIGLASKPELFDATELEVVRRLAQLTRLCELIGVEPVRVGSVPFALIADACLAGSRGDAGPTPDAVWFLPRSEWHSALAQRDQRLLTPVEARDSVDDVRIVCAAFGTQQAVLVLVDGRTFVVESPTHQLQVNWSEDTSSDIATPRRFTAGLAEALAGRRLLYGVAGKEAGCRPNSYELTVADQAVIFEAPDLRVRIVDLPRMPWQDGPEEPF